MISDDAQGMLLNSHTPEGVTMDFSKAIYFIGSFNPRTREGCDGIGTVIISPALFQSTHP